MNKSRTLEFHEYARVRALADEIAQLSKHGMAHFDNLPLNDHIHLMDEINRSTHTIRDTLKNAVS